MSDLKRFAIFTGRVAPVVYPLCFVAARDKRHALQIARQTFMLSRKAYATQEGAR